jgi:uncharacterized protein (DUF697 family)
MTSMGWDGDGEGRMIAKHAVALAGLAIAASTIQSITSAIA